MVQRLSVGSARRARFDDRITGRLSDFCPHASKIHIDIDPGSIDKVVRADVALVGDCYPLLRALRKELSHHELPEGRLNDWWQRIGVWRAQECLKVTPRSDAILPQHLLERSPQLRSFPSAGQPAAED